LKILVSLIRIRYHYSRSSTELLFSVNRQQRKDIIPILVRVLICAHLFILFWQAAGGGAVTDFE
jgi:hypothetical protein